MNKKFLIYGMIISLFLLHSCKKGDTGPQGETGPQGIQGTQGIKGENGTMIYSGTNVPAANLGVDGDFYVRLSNGSLYGPKKNGAWGTPVSLKGSTGTAGSKILSGSALPTSATGVVGDYYFQTTSTTLFGPKTASGWPASGTNLRGIANVWYSDWKPAVRFKDTVMDGTNFRIAHIYEPRLTQTILKTGTVLMYLDYGGGLYPLPYTSSAGLKMSTIGFHLKQNEIVITRQVYDGGALVNLSSSLRYRYVIIPGGVYIALNKRGVDLRDPVKLEKEIENLKVTEPELFK